MKNYEATIQQLIQLTYCITGDIADAYDDLGVLSSVDKCCREHDHCPTYLASLTGSEEYGGLFNYNIISTK